VVEVDSPDESTGSDMLSEKISEELSEELNLADEGIDPVLDANQSSSPDFEEFVQMADPPQGDDMIVEGWGGSEAATDEKFEEDLAEADFYLQQGMKEEAVTVYQRLVSLFPHRAEPVERLADLVPPAEQPVDATLPENTEKKIDADSFFKDLNATSDQPMEESAATEITGKKIDANSFFEDLSAVPDKPREESSGTDEELANIFDAFKKGVEDEVEESDFETHYNLGIAYKEMGLLDDAIREFKTASKVQGDSFQGSSMLAMCYVEKGSHEQAVSEYRKLMNMLDETDDRYLPVKYDLAVSVEQSGDASGALELFTGIYNEDPSFGDVAARIDNLQQ